MGRLFLHIVLLLGILLSWPYRLPAAENEAILNLPAESAVLPLLQPVLIDPLRLKQMPVNAAALEKIEQRIQADRKAFADGEAKAQVAKRILDRMVIRAAYWQKLDDGSGGEISRKRLTMQRELLDFAKVGEKFLTDAREKKRLRFSIVLTQYLVNPKLARASLKSLESNIPEQQDLLDFLRALDEVILNPRVVNQDLEDKAGRLGTRASIIAALARARASSDSYRFHLLYASRLCQDLSLPERERIFRFSLGVWTKKADFQEKWEPLPFQVSCFLDVPSFPALLERMAQYALVQKNPEKAAIYYQQAAERSSGLQLRSRPDLLVKAAEMYRLSYEENGKREEYQSFLVRVSEPYKGTVAGKKMMQMHDDLLHAELKRALQAQAAKATLEDIRKVYDTYMLAAVESPDARRIRASWADLLEKNKENAEAASVLLSLARGSGGLVRSAYQQRALALQTGVVAWQLDKPWTNPKPQDSQQLARLAEIMDLYQASTQSRLSFAISRARVAQQLGLVEEMRTRFRNILPQATSSLDKNEIFTTLLTAAMDAQDFADMEKLCESAWRFGYGLARPLPDDQSVKSVYQYALDRQAQEFFAKNEWKASIGKLNKLIAVLPPSSPKNEALYLKARNLQNLGDHLAALEVLSFIEVYGFLDETKAQAILDKAAIEAAQARLADGILSYEKFLTAAPKDDRVLEVHMSLSDLYLAADEPDNARRHLLEVMAGGDLEGPKTQVVTEKLARIHQALKKPELLTADIDAVRKDLPDEKLGLARLLNLQLRERQSQNAKTALQFYFDAEDSSLFAVADLFSEEAFLQAKAFAGENFAKKQQEYTQTVAPPLDTVKKTYQASVDMYAKACAINFATYCAPALAESLFEAQRYQGWIASLTIEGQEGQKDELYDFFALESEAIAKNLDDVLRRGSSLPTWLQKYARESPALWRLLAAYRPSDQNYLDAPDKLEKNSDLQFTKGVGP